MGGTLVKAIALLFALFVLASTVYSQRIYWSPVNTSDANRSDHPEAKDDKLLFQLDYSGFAGILQKPTNGPSELAFPTSNGAFETFQVENYPIVEQELLEKFAKIRIYQGRSTTSNALVRFVVNGIQLRAVLANNGTYYQIDPLAASDQYAFEKVSHKTSYKDFQCLTDQDDLHSSFKSQPSAGLRQFRIAIATTAEYTAYHGGSVFQGLFEVISALTRINAIFESELSTRFILVGDNDKIIFTNAQSDPYDNENLSSMMVENPNVLNARIGVNNYDIGHVFGTEGGGIANVGVICSDALKGRGATGLNVPDGDFFHIVYVCHEIGHQLGAKHSFNNCLGFGGWPYGVEPGSGTTIMAYAGLCDANNVSSETDYYFHSASIDLMSQYGNGCAEIIPNNNSVPVITITSPAELYIPRSTPFKLEGFAQDDDDVLYTWDEVDVGPVSPYGNPQGSAPLFRFQSPTETGTRFFPKWETVLLGQSDPAEVLPNYGRSISLRLTARDLNPNGTVVSYAEYSLDVAGAAGPFRVSSQADSTIWEIGNSYMIEWDVAKTDVPPVSSPLVRIVLFDPDTLSHQIILANGVQNNGHFEFTLADVPQKKYRLLVESVSNVFYAINKGVIKVVSPNIPCPLVNVSTTNLLLCPGKSAELSLFIGPSNTPYDTVWLQAVHDAPGLSAQFDRPYLLAGDTINLQLHSDGPIDHSLVVEMYCKGKLFDTATVLLESPTSLASVAQLYPLNAHFNVPSPFDLEWTAGHPLTTYHVQIARDMQFEQLVDEFVSPFNSMHINYLPKGDLYYWRVRNLNTCAEGAWSSLRFFHINPHSCVSVQNNTPVDISEALPNTAASTIELNDSFQVSTIAINNLDVIHDKPSDLQLYLGCPDQNLIPLTVDICIDSTHFNVSFQSDIVKNTSLCLSKNDSLIHPQKDLYEHYNALSTGTWNLIALDHAAQNGGAIQSWGITLCGSSEDFLFPERNIAPLVALKNASLAILWNSLFSSSPDILDYRLVLVEAPKHGSLLLDKDLLSIGSLIDGANLLNDQLIYQHNGNSEDSDQITFAIMHSNGRARNNITLHIAIQEDVLAASIDVLNVPDCYGDNSGEILVSAAGGFAPYEFSVNGEQGTSDPFFHSLTAGYYAFKITDSLGNDLFVNPIFLSEPDSISIEVGQDYNDVFISAVGGTGNLTYFLNNDLISANGQFENLDAGWHQIQVTDDNLCVAEKRFFINYEQLTANIAYVDHVDCFGDSNGQIGVQILGGRSPYTVSMNDGPFNPPGQLNNLSAGVYTISIRDAENEALILDSIEIREPSPLNFGWHLLAGAVEINASGGRPPYIYQVDDQLFQTDSIFTAPGFGLHSFAVQDQGRCEIQKVIFVGTTSIGYPETRSGVSIMPNPSRGSFAVVYRTAKPSKIGLVDPTGKQRPFQMKCLNEGKVHIDTKLPTGLYYLCIQWADQAPLIKEVVIVN